MTTHKKDKHDQEPDDQDFHVDFTVEANISPKAQEVLGKVWNLGKTAAQWLLPPIITWLGLNVMTPSADPKSQPMLLEKTEQVHPGHKQEVSQH
jgi:hypothetical protein